LLDEQSPYSFFARQQLKKKYLVTSAHGGEPGKQSNNLWARGCSSSTIGVLRKQCYQGAFSQEDAILHYPCKGA